MSIISYLSLSLSSLGVDSCIYKLSWEGWGGRKQDDSKKAWASSYMVPLQKRRARHFWGQFSPPPFGNQSTLLLCVFRYIFYIACLTECKECQAFCLFAWIGPPHPQASVAPPFGSKRGDTLAYGGGRGGTQFQRRDWHSGTLCIL
jgi:hypothetical protein